MKTFFWLVILFLFCTCEDKLRHSHLDDCNVVATNEVNGEDTFMVCDFARLNDTIFFPLSELVGKLEIIRLDTCRDALCNPDGAAISISDKYIAVAGFESPIKLFNRKTGKYLSQIGSKGQGPGEYSTAFPIQIDEKSQSIYTQSYHNILRYNLSGEYITKYPLVYPALTGLISVDPIKQEITVLSGQSNAFQDSKPIWVQSFDGSIKQELLGSELGVSRIPESNGYVNTKSNSLYVFHRESRPDFLYHYDAMSNRLQPKFSVKWGNEIPSHVYTELPGYYCCFFGQKFSQMILVDKTTGKGSFVKLVIDEWDKDFLWTDVFKTYQLVGHEEFVCLIDPLKLSGNLDKGFDKLIGEKLNLRSLEDENSWAVIGRWKY